MRSATKETCLWGYFNSVSTFIEPVKNSALIKGKVTAIVQKQGKGPKLTIFRTKAKSNWSRKQGHRQPYTRLLIEEIKVN